ncbi:uncharacterized protein LOC114758143 isoform X2 [Neltuma alba]|uniref:uncharacterized protein LOC114758143 isoform X2 n=1 Tax=Neltuma alba TaxID=207710 RepID=UPI0010A4480D|nr:uncharacterized protein LOC114758143 isoform X2 [Prosopis alba]
MVMSVLADCTYSVPRSQTIIVNGGPQPTAFPSIHPLLSSLLVVKIGTASISNYSDEDPSIAVFPAGMKRESSEAGQAMGKSHYMFWVFTAIILLAVWSLFTGSLTLKWSAPNLSRFSFDLDSRVLDDLDVLEVEEREKLVKRMWDVYTHSSTIRLPRFWSAAFQAAYEHLVSDVPGVRDSAISEIAQMSLRSSDLDILPLQSESDQHVKEN